MSSSCAGILISFQLGYRRYVAVPLYYLNQFVRVVSRAWGGVRNGNLLSQGDAARCWEAVPLLSGIAWGT